MIIMFAACWEIVGSFMYFVGISQWFLVASRLVAGQLIITFISCIYRERDVAQSIACPPLKRSVVGSILLSGERDVAQSIACPPLKRSVVGSILLSGPSCSLGYFPFQPVVHNWFIKGRGMYCSVYGKSAYKRSLAAYRKE